MSQSHTAQAREPLVHLSKRSAIHPLKAWGVRLIALILGLIVCGLVAFLLIDKLKGTFSFIKQHYKVINLVCGIFLIVIGVLMATGLMTRVIGKLM